MASHGASVESCQKRIILAVSSADTKDRNTLTAWAWLLASRSGTEQLGLLTTSLRHPGTHSLTLALFKSLWIVYCFVSSKPIMALISLLILCLPETKGTRKSTDQRLLTWVLQTPMWIDVGPTSNQSPDLSKGKRSRPSQFLEDPGRLKSKYTSRGL